MNATVMAFPRARRRVRPLRVGMLIGSVARSGGGVPRVLRALSLALSALPGISVEVFSLDTDPAGRLDFGGIPLHLAAPSGPAAFGYAPALLPLLAERRPDILHVHGLWMYLSVAAHRWHRRTGRPYLVSPHGMIDPWALRNAFWKKKLARLLYEDRHLGDAAVLHALCAAEAEAARAMGLSRPLAVIPNGTEPLPPAAAPPGWRAALPEDARVLLFFGRVTPKKGVGPLIRAWAAVAPRHPRWHLVLAGPDEGGYGAHLAALASAGQAPARLHLVGPAYGEERAAAYRSASAFVLPSVSEGLPLTVLEALSAGLPVLLTPECNVPEAASAGAGLLIGAGEAEIAAGLERLMRLPDAELAAMGERGRALAADRFDWNRIALRFAELYRSLAPASASLTA